MTDVAIVIVLALIFPLGLFYLWVVGQLILWLQRTLRLPAILTGTLFFVAYLGGVWVFLLELISAAGGEENLWKLGTVAGLLLCVIGGIGGWWQERRQRGRGGATATARTDEWSVGAGGVHEVTGDDGGGDG